MKPSSAIALILGCALFASCAKRTPVKPPEVHQTFQVEQVDANTVIVGAYGAKGEADAKEYLCTTTYICVREDVPIHFYKLTRTRK